MNRPLDDAVRPGCPGDAGQPGGYPASPVPGPLSVTARPPSDADPCGGLGLAGEFDLAGLPTWHVTAAAWSERHGGDVVVDLLRLRFLDAAGMGALVVFGNSLRAVGNRMTLCRPAPNVRRALAAGGLSHLMSA